MNQDIKNYAQAVLSAKSTGLVLEEYYGNLAKDCFDIAEAMFAEQIKREEEQEAEVKDKPQENKLIIDLDSEPFCPEGWTVESHKKGGIIEYSPDMVKLYLSEKQKKKGKMIKGIELRKELKNLPVMNANLLDWYLAHPNEIPGEWKNKSWISFWGTVYHRSSGNLVVRCLCWTGARWDWRICWLDCWFDDSIPCVVSAS